MSKLTGLFFIALGVVVLWGMKETGRRPDTFDVIFLPFVFLIGIKALWNGIAEGITEWHDD